jgi:sulfur carrier protein
MKISINGKMQFFDKEVLTFETLIREINLEGRRFAIERNGEIIPKSQFNEYTLNDGDKLEIIGAVGGG